MIATNRRLALVLLVVAMLFVLAMVGVSLWTESDFWLIALPAYVTGAGTLALAVATVVLATGDRDRDDRKRKEDRDRDDHKRAEDREQAAEDARLARAASDRAAADARDEAEARLQREWDHQEATRRAEFQRVYAEPLIEILDRLRAHALVIPFLPHHSGAGGYDEFRREDARRAIADLKHASRSTVVLVGNRELSRRFGVLVTLAMQAAEALPPHAIVPSRIGHDLLAYSLYVRFGIHELLESGDVEFQQQEYWPVIFRDGNDCSIWAPANPPRGWQEALNDEPDHPNFVPYADRRP